MVAHWLPWQHDYRPTGAQQMLEQHFQSPLYTNWDGTPVKHGQPEPVTVVLERCSCGRSRTRTLEGHWSLEEVRGT